MLCCTCGALVNGQEGRIIDAGDSHGKFFLIATAECVHRVGKIFSWQYTRWGGPHQVAPGGAERDREGGRDRGR